MNVTLMKHSEPPADFPKLKPWWKTPTFLISLLVGAGITVFILAFINTALQLTPAQLLRYPPAILLTLTIIGWSFGFGRSEGMEDAETLHSKQMVEWYLQNPQQLLKALEGQTFEDKILSTAKLHILHATGDGLFATIVCQKTPEEMLEVHCRFDNQPTLTKVTSRQKEEMKTYFLQHNRDVYQRLYGTPDVW
ncbi:hypothetical protein [Deinococcus roseus]|uniref:DUF3239 domain-containing protein n=1 Tax=Deinococcus roseus TaxID=392414 RepID=A0ABQ2D5N3_9DEIO|nr:hypothetical protein [Deinococcus roseus]GGJ44382.1 hypothetical protein GCM10008938_33230 [Deinococcus roseus]